MRLSSSLECVSGNTNTTVIHYLMRGSIPCYSHASSTSLITKGSNDTVANSSASASWLSKSRTPWKAFVSAIFKIHRFVTNSFPGLSFHRCVVQASKTKHFCSTSR
ncbi:hypothetical protein ARMGADRAFT_147917 [Armillaria gallica]|uniref:Uncharacterized protein n=1 Tax=Armillaria gallica TaxID=47427 RepID=A0A2H3DD00_ARMGA|nr:hypothetical protein ARMGADRAFT_147917 [Armillaria gallica]